MERHCRWRRGGAPRVERRERGERGVGVWLIISPFVLGFSNAPTPLWNNIVLGALVFIIALAFRPAPPEIYRGANLG